MPGYKTHIIFGIFLSAIALYFYWQGNHFSFFPDLIFLFFIVLFYSLLPDIDHQSSKIRWVVTILGLLSGLVIISISSLFDLGYLFFYGILFIVAVLFLSVMQLIKGFKHRQITHKMVTSVFFSIPLIFYGVHFFIGGLVSYSSHVLLDGLTKKVRKNGR